MAGVHPTTEDGAMTQLLPDDRQLYSRYRELGALADALLDLEPEELLFFRVAEDGSVTAHGDAAVLIVKDTRVPFMARAASVYGDLPDPGSTRIYWFTPADLERPSTAEFVAEVRAAGEPIVPPPSDEGAEAPDCGSSGSGV
jgi:hypothetical protein